MEMVVAIEILLMTIVRVGNLTSLEEGRHLRWGRSNRRGLLSLSVEADEVKNGRALDFELPTESARLIRLYMDRYRPLLRCPPSGALFPDRDGAPKRPSLLSEQIKRFVKKRLGLNINAHLFRHIGAKLFLEENPGAYASVQLLAGHRSSDTTVDHYIGLEATEAARHYDDLILNRRRRRPLSRKRRRR